MNYTLFTKYPLQIKGVNQSNNEELIAIETHVKSEIDYTGNENDLEFVLPYFVFFKFCEVKRTEVTATNGEQSQVAEFTLPSTDHQVRVWNTAAKKLADLCAEKNAAANKHYLSKINFLC
jgi:hypothetical protein